MLNFFIVLQTFIPHKKMTILHFKQERAAQEAWLQYETITMPLAQELCEQLRLVLEPTQASKLKQVLPWIVSFLNPDSLI